jgi:hypothetical protein
MIHHRTSLGGIDTTQPEEAYFKEHRGVSCLTVANCRLRRYSSHQADHLQAILLAIDRLTDKVDHISHEQQSQRRDIERQNREIDRQAVELDRLRDVTYNAQVPTGGRETRRPGLAISIPGGLSGSTTSASRQSRESPLLSSSASNAHHYAQEGSVSASQLVHSSHQQNDYKHYMPSHAASHQVPPASRGHHNSKNTVIGNFS